MSCCKHHSLNMGQLETTKLQDSMASSSSANGVNLGHSSIFKLLSEVSFLNPNNEFWSKYSFVCSTKSVEGSGSSKKCKFSQTTISSSSKDLSFCIPGIDISSWHSRLPDFEALMAGTPLLSTVDNDTYILSSILAYEGCQMEA